MQFDQLQRRDFVTVLGSVAAWPLVARAQQPSKAIIGYVSGRSAQTDVPMVDAFREGLNEHGYIEGQNVVIEYRWADGQFAELHKLVDDLVSRRVSIIVTSGGEVVARTAKAATSTIPIVFLGAGDPVQFGLVASMNRPGGNLTGITMLLFELTTKQLGLLRELVPAAARIAVLANPGTMAAESQINDANAAAKAIGQQLTILTATNEQQIDSAFKTVQQEQLRALLVLASPFFVVHAKQIIAHAAHYRVPTLYFRRELAQAGGLISYGSSTEESYRQAGIYAARILKGEKPADLPIVQSAKFELVINLKTAKALGLDVPPTLLARADEVIE